VKYESIFHGVNLRPTKLAPKGAKLLMVSKMPDMKRSSGMGRVKVEPLWSAVSIFAGWNRVSI